MAEVLPPQPQTSTTTTTSSTPVTPITPNTDSLESSSTTEATPRPRVRSRIPPSDRSARQSTVSRQTSTHSRPSSTVFPAFHSSLPYALVRDFAYPIFHPMHYGPAPDEPSGTTTPGSEWNSGRRLSDPSAEAWNSGASRGGAWTAGPWGGDGVMYPEPLNEGDVEALPSTSFGEDFDDDNTTFGYRKSKHRKSKSYTNLSELERGRRRESGSGFNRRSRAADGGGGGDAYFDPAGQGSLRQSRNYGHPNSAKREQHFAGTLPSRSFHTSHTPDADEELLPLDAEQSLHAQSPQRASMGPDDELYAGESLALYSFEPENPNELRLREGQIILVSYRHGQGWLVAEDPDTGEQGLVPEEYVRLVREIESWDPERGGFIEDESMLLDDSARESSPDSESDERQGEEAALDGQAHGEGEEEDSSQDLPVVDHAQGLHMKDLRSEALEKATDLLEGRQDSAHGDS